MIIAIISVFDAYEEVVKLHKLEVLLDQVVHSSHGTLIVAVQVWLHCRGPGRQWNCHYYLADGKNSIPGGLEKTLDNCITCSPNSVNGLTV